MGKVLTEQLLKRVENFTALCALAPALHFQTFRVTMLTDHIKRNMMRESNSNYEKTGNFLVLHYEIFSPWQKDRLWLQIELDVLLDLNMATQLGYFDAGDAVQKTLFQYSWEIVREVQEQIIADAIHQMELKGKTWLCDGHGRSFKQKANKKLSSTFAK